MFKVSINILKIVDLNLMMNIKVHMGQFLREIRQENLPTFVGIKFTSEAFDEGIQALNAQDKKFVVFLGTESVYYVLSS